jgi:hypothetical protein
VATEYTCGKCGRKTPWPGDCTVHLDEFVIVDRPAITVTARRFGTNGNAIDVSYDANHVAVVVHDSRWHLSFECSGSITLIPIGDVKSVVVSARGAQWCLSCDARLTAYPSGDPSYHRVLKKETA